MNQHDYDAKRYTDNANNSQLGSVEYWNNVNSAKNSQAISESMKSEENCFSSKNSSNTNYNPLPINNNSVYYSSGNYNKNDRIIFSSKNIVFLLFAILSYFSYSWYVDNRIVSNYILESEHTFYSGYIISNNTKKEDINRIKESNIKIMKEVYSNLFQTNTPFEIMEKNCFSSSCSGLTINNLKKIQSYAINQSTYWNDLCNLNFKNHLNYTNTIDHKWEIKQDKTNTICSTTNDKQVKEAGMAQNGKVRGIGFLIAGFFLSLGFFCYWKIGKTIKK